MLREACPICGRSPCAAGCPNEDPPEPALTCDCCGEVLYEGDEYYSDIDGDNLCENCFYTWSRRRCKTASLDDSDDLEV